MIFPRDVHSVLQNQRKLVGQNKTQLIVTIFIVGNIACFFFLSHVFSAYVTKDIKWVIITQLLIMVIIGIFVFRFFIFNESEKTAEYQNANSDSFARYLYLRKDLSKEIAFGNHKVNAFEFVNGTSTCTFIMRFGSTDNRKSKNTCIMFEQLASKVSSYGFEFRFVTMSEDFRTSKEFAQHIAQINNIQDVEFRKTIMGITNCVMDVSERESNTDIVYFTIRTVSNYQKAELEALLREVLTIFAESNTSLRSIYSLNADQLLDFYRHFYKIAAIDLTMMKAIELSEDLDNTFANIVKLIELRSTDGRVFQKDQDLDNLFSIPERRI